MAAIDRRRSRVAVEGSYAEIKVQRTKIVRHHTHVFGVIKNAILLVYAVAGVNMRILRAWHAKRALTNRGQLNSAPHEADRIQTELIAHHTSASPPRTAVRH